MAELSDAKYDADKLPEGKLRFVSLFVFKTLESCQSAFALTKWNCLIQWLNYEDFLVLLLMLKLNKW